ncbi:hypothetical protein COCON_G00113030 [Conger conger]|uniref:12S rRNA N(4)-cytidine methyltransferase METTL15 n=1 Tax=Conger conger TaxID=82655 RepID=A0A9Q1I063_CONCO|nr:probable methyltransferase-like protein 15 [Conger conger]KAJ8272444.1 hypothetical protein COCON_G00113030 [Conger conger]
MYWIVTSLRVTAGPFISPWKAVFAKPRAKQTLCGCWKMSQLSTSPHTFTRKSSVQQDSGPGSAVSAGGALHTPVMIKEVLQWLGLQPGQVFLDMTFGAGGHTKAVMNATPDVTVYALDRDPVAFQIIQQLSEQHPGQINSLLGRFSELSALLSARGVEPGSLDGVLLDAGCCSMQLDCPERGFSLSRDGPLDMRMDGNRCPAMPNAADVVNALDQHALASILSTYGEERHARKIASAIVEARCIYPIRRTQQLASIVAGAFPAGALYARRDLLQRPAHLATKTFQALRIFVNDELNELYAGLQAAQAFLRPGGRLCVLTFHSLEDRTVKRFLQGLDPSAPPCRGLHRRTRPGAEAGPGHEEAEPASSADWAILHKGVITPHREEVQANPRGRSAKLRVACKL